jgi:hypothetical protein
MPLKNSLASGQDLTRIHPGAAQGGTVNQRLLYNRNARIQTGRLNAFGNIVNAAISKTQAGLFARRQPGRRGPEEGCPKPSSGPQRHGHWTEPWPRPHQEAAVVARVRNGPDRAADGAHQPVFSRISKAMALTPTHWLISARHLFMASMLTVGTTNAAPGPRACSHSHILTLWIKRRWIKRRRGGVNPIRAKIALRFWRLP